MPKESHLFHFSHVVPQNRSAGGYRIRATKENFPLLEGMSLYKLMLNPKFVREPHWHANADELGYCLKGKILVSFYATKNQRTNFLVNPGEAFFIPSGAIHSIENVGEGVAELILQFSNELPEDFSLSGSFGMFSDAVLGNTWDVSCNLFKHVERSTNEVFIANMKRSTIVSKEAYYASPYRYNLDGASPLIENEGGQARVARSDVWPILKRQALYSLKLTGQGMREPHWHPETAELGYVNKGKGRMSIQSPSGSVDTYEMEAGDIYFIPKAYPHHIENLITDPLEILIFFDQPMPADIGFTASVKSFSDEVVHSVLGTSEELIHTLPTYYSDLFIVKKVNPVDHSIT